jgi:hypothetical protein
VEFELNAMIIAGEPTVNTECGPESSRRERSPMGQRTWISRSEIAEIYDQRAKLAAQREVESAFSDNGLEIWDLEARADLMREIDGMENKVNLRDHVANTKQANFENEAEAQIVHRSRKPPRQLQLVKLPEGQELL